MTERKKKTRAAEVANTFEWLITAFILALIVRGFVIEAFRIPTGSMAATLRGDHYRMRCRQCGYRYDYGLDGFAMAQEGFGGRATSRCPSCGYLQNPDHTLSFVNGDRILVLRWLYNFFEPQRWDVVVFKNPVEPEINYIKRMVAGPGETLEFIDGNVFINDQIQRKPPKVQSELWMPIYNNDYQPIRPSSPRFDSQTWRQPFVNVDQSQWKTSSTEKPTRFILESGPDQRHIIEYDPVVGNGFRATYAYNSTPHNRFQPYCSDLMIRFKVTKDVSDGVIGASLTKYGVEFIAMADYSTGKLILKSAEGDNRQELASVPLPESVLQQPAQARLFQFSNSDQMLIAKYGQSQIYHDLGREPDVFDMSDQTAEPAVRIIGSANLELSRIALYRDIYYTSRSIGDGRPARGGEGNPITLEQDQFFMVGDNTPNSEDSRFWKQPGLGNNGKTYDPGIVPREYLVGKAMFVYFPGGYRPSPGFPLSIVPDLGRMKFIYGGAEEYPPQAAEPYTRD